MPPDPPQDNQLIAFAAVHNHEAVRQVHSRRPVGAENLCHQAIFMNHTPGAVTPLNPELIQVGDSVGQRASGAACFKARCGRWSL